MYECRETRQKWHRAAVATYYRIRALSLSRFFLFPQSICSFFLFFFFHLIFFFRTFPVCSKDDKWEEEETHTHTHTYKSVGNTTYSSKKRNDRIATDQMHTRILIRIQEKKTIRFNTYVTVYWHEAKIEKKTIVL